MAKISFKDVEVRYGNVVAISGVSLKVREKEFVVILGPSGAGKTTLLRCINGFVRPVKGAVVVDGTNGVGADEAQLRELRKRIGAIYQQFNLIKRLNVLQNVLCGRLGHVDPINSVFGAFSEHDVRIARTCLRKVGMSRKMHQRADTLSGGEQQRVAIARALAQQPSIMLADEPVTNLDHTLAHHIMELLLKIWKEEHVTMLLSIHNLELVREYCLGMRLIGLNSGKIVYDGKVDKINKRVLAKIYGGLDKVEL
jgi:phosphonate transport system ATP-binding protein